MNTNPNTPSSVPSSMPVPIGAAPPKRSRTLLVALIVGAVVLVSAGVVWAVWVFGREDAKTGETATVSEGPLLISVTVSGTIKNREQVILRSEVEGRPTIQWLIDEGVQVKPGDKLVDLDSSKLDDQLVQQEIVARNAQAAYVRARETLAVTISQSKSDMEKAKLANDFAVMDRDKYVKGEYVQQLKQAKADITIAKEELERAEDIYGWSMTLAAEGYITETELQADELASNRSNLNVELAEGKLDLLENHTYKRTIAELDSNIQQTKDAWDRAIRKAKADVVQAQVDHEAKGMENDNQAAKLKKVADQITKCTIKAPVAGMVVYATTGKVNWRGSPPDSLAEGREVREREELIYLPTNSSMMAAVKVHESSLRKVTEGLPVLMRVDALPGRTFNAHVAKIAPMVDGQGGMMSNPDLKVYSTEINIDDNAEELRAGMSCQCTIVVAQYPKALYVPIQSVVREGDQHVAYVVGSKGAERREVEVGLDNTSHIRIVSGLSKGEEVLQSPPLKETAAADNTAELVATMPTSPQAGAPRGMGSLPPGFDPAKMAQMTPEERRAYIESLPADVQEQLRGMRGAGGGARPDAGQPGAGGGRQGRQGRRPAGDENTGADVAP